MTDLFHEGGAEISDCGRYRYVLWRRWDKSKPRLGFIMLNPSTADANVDDATIRVCMGRARRMGYGGIRVTNLFAFRTKSPEEMKGNYIHHSLDNAGGVVYIQGVNKE